MNRSLLYIFSKQSFRRVLIGFAFLLCFSNNLRAQVVDWPYIPLENVNYDIHLEGDGEFEVSVDDKIIQVNEESGKQFFNLTLHSGQEISIISDGKEVLNKKVKTIPLWLSILPPLLAIVLALVFKEVITSLFIGLFVGTLIPAIYNDGIAGIFTALLSIVDKYIINALNNRGHLSVIVFSMLIGATVTVISKNGGMKGVVEHLSKYAKSRRSGQFVTWLLGILIFFDDYANTLIVGNTMRPITDKLKISREKLSYIVDSTAAPIAAIAFVTTWIGAELGYIEEGMQNLTGINESVYHIFLNSLQYSFYPILTLLFIVMLIFLKKDFGPMVLAETKAVNSSEIDQLITVNQNEMKDFEPDDKTKFKWYNAAIPVFVIISVTMVSLVYTGYDSDVWQQTGISFAKKLSDTIGQADSYTALLWSSIIGLLTAVFLSLTQRLLSIHQVVGSIISGFKTMLTAMIILVLAWSLSNITSDLHTADFLTNLISGHMSPFIFPAVTFVLSALVAFATGSSWGTMAILYPLLMPLSWEICGDYNLEYSTSISIFYNTVSCVLAGSVLGDHCSPISDTTILSSLASSCNHIEHVRTQLPYALTVGLIALFLGTLPSAFGVSPILCFIISIATLYFIIVKFGKNVEPAESISNQISDI